MTPTKLTFNKDMMTVSDLKKAAECLDNLFMMFDRNLLGGDIKNPKSWDRDQADQFCLDILQMRERYITSDH